MNAFCLQDKGTYKSWFALFYFFYYNFYVYPQVISFCNKWKRLWVCILDNATGKKWKKGQTLVSFVLTYENWKTFSSVFTTYVNCIVLLLCFVYVSKPLRALSVFEPFFKNCSQIGIIMICCCSKVENNVEGTWTLLTLDGSLDDLLSDRCLFFVPLFCKIKPIVRIMLGVCKNIFRCLLIFWRDKNYKKIFKVST